MPHLIAGISLIGIALIFGALGCNKSDSNKESTSTNEQEIIGNDDPSSEETIGQGEEKPNAQSASTSIAVTLNSEEKKRVSRTAEESMRELLGSLRSNQNAAAVHIWYLMLDGDPVILGVKNSLVKLRSKRDGSVTLLDFGVKDYDLYNNGNGYIEFFSEVKDSEVSSGVHRGENIRTDIIVHMSFDSQSGNHDVLYVESKVNVEGLPNYRFYKKDRFDSPRVDFFRELFKDIQVNNAVTIREYRKFANSTN